MNDRIEAGPQPVTQYSYAERIRREFVDGQPEDVVLRIEAEMFEVGRVHAARSGKTSLDKQTLPILRDLADAAAGRYAAVPFAPETDPADALEARDEARHTEREERLVQRADHARAHAADAKYERAVLGSAPAEPPPPLVAGLLGAMGIAVTATPTIHEVFVAKVVTNPVQSLVVSFLFALVIAAGLTWMLLRDATDPTRASKAVSATALTAAVLLPLGMGILRANHPLVAVGFGLVEFAIVLGIEHVRLRLTDIAAAGAEKRAIVAAAERRVAVAVEEVAQAEAALAHVERLRALHVERVRVRSHLARAAPTLQAAARSAIEAGYLSGISATHGQLFGASVKMPGLADARESVGGPNRGRKE